MSVLIILDPRTRWLLHCEHSLVYINPVEWIEDIWNQLTQVWKMGGKILKLKYNGLFWFLQCHLHPRIISGTLICPTLYYQLQSSKKMHSLAPTANMWAPSGWRAHNMVHLRASHGSWWLSMFWPMLMSWSVRTHKDPGSPSKLDPPVFHCLKFPGSPANPWSYHCWQTAGWYDKNVENEIRGNHRAPFGPQTLCCRRYPSKG